MRLASLLLIVFSGMIFGEAMEVRSYQVGETLFFQMHYERTVSGDAFGDAFESDEARENYRGKVVTVAPFKSRFFEGAGELKDCSKAMGELLNTKGWKGMAVLDLDDGELVVKAGVRDHRAIAQVFEERISGQVEAEVLIYRVKVGASEAGVDEVSEKGELLAGLSFLQIPGQMAEASAGGFTMQSEVQLDRDYELVESRLSLSSTIEGAEFELKTGYITVRGEPMAVKLGSLDGKQALVAVLKYERVLFNGVSFDEWILKEKGGAFLREERLARGRKPEVIEEEEIRRFTVPPTFIAFISTAGGGGGDEDPFATEVPESKNVQVLYEGDHSELAKVPRHKLFDVTTLLEKNGVEFREEDFAVFLEPSSTLLVKASAVNLELVEGIVGGGGGYIPKLVRLDFARMVSDAEIDRESLEKGGLKMRKQIGVDVLPGQVGKVRLGKKLILHAEAQVDSYNELIEMRATLSERGNLEKASFKTGLTLWAGKPVVVQQSRRGEKWVAWVATATVITVGEEIE